MFTPPPLQSFIQASVLEPFSCGASRRACGLRHKSALDDDREATQSIDEGFGSLHSGSLDLAIEALERLQARGRTFGVISHVQATKDRIPVQLQVQKTGGGASEIDLVAP